jgi:hypothetical protein
MKFILTVSFFFTFAFASAQSSNRGLVFNKELKILVGKWEGNSVYTDPRRNNAQITLRSQLDVTDLGDSLQLIFTYTDPEKIETGDTSILRIYDKEDKVLADRRLYDIGYTARKGPSMIVVGEKEGYDNIIKPGFDPSLKADFRYTLTFSPTSLSILRELRFMENEYYFIRMRSTYKKL